jgi:hypothetical protein
LLFAAGIPALADQPVEKYTLKPVRKIGQLHRYEAALQVGGELKLVDNDREKSVPMSVVANLKYDEHLLALDAQGRPARSARYYDDVRAVIKVDQGGEKPQLAAKHRLIVAECSSDSPAVMFCPHDPLSREELDLIDVQANTLLLDQLLPGQPIAVGESWTLNNDFWAQLLGLDAVSWSEVQCVLGQVTDGTADIAAAGSVSGAVGGVTTEIELKIKLKYLVQPQQFSQFAILVKEKRAVGHVGPGLDTIAKLLISIRPITESAGLSAAALQSIPPQTSPELQRLHYASQRGQFHFDYDRRWYLTSDDPKLAIWRLLDRGALVAQCNMSPLSPKKEPLTLPQFQRDVEQSLGKNFGQFTKATKTTNQAGYTVFRVVAQGKVSELPIEWVYYLLQDDQGRGVSLAFTYEQELASRLGEADQLLVDRLRILPAPTPTATKPVRQN